ncbi:MAG: hypothetical protein AAF488_07250 [Planctomycetota bacterium]
MRFVLLAVAFFGAIGIGVVVGRPTAPHDPPPAEVRDSSKETAASSEGPSSQRGSPTPAIAPAETDSEPVPASAATTDTLLDVITAFPVGEWDRGAGAITGSVRDSSGAPLVDVEVRAIIWGTTPGVDQAPPQEVSLSKYIATEIEQFHYDHSMITIVRTYTDGRFEIPDLKSDAQYHLYVVESGWFAYASNKNRISPGETCDLTAYRTAPVELRVRLSDGSPVYAGRIWVGDRNDTGRLDPFAYVGSWSHNAPTMDLPAEFSSLSFVSSEGERSGFVPTEFVAGTPTVFEVELPSRPRIHCKIDAPPGTNFGGWSVGLQSVDETDPSEFYSYRRFTVRGPSAFLQASEPGPVRVGLMTGDAVVHHVEVEVGDGVTPVSLQLPTPIRARGIEVRLLDSEGRPIDGCTIQSSILLPPGAWVNSSVAKSGDGSYWVWFSGAYQPEVDFALEQVVLTCTSPRHGTQQVTVEMTDAPRAELVFQEPGWLMVDTTEVRDATLLNRLELALASADSEGGGPNEAFTLVGGQTQVRLGPVAPGYDRGKNFTHN